MSLTFGDFPQEIVSDFCKSPDCAARFKSVKHQTTPRHVLRTKHWSTGAMKKISQNDKEFCPSEAVGRRVATFYRRRYPSNTAKLTANEMAVAEVTARGWLSGRCPQAHHLCRMMMKYGRAFMADVFEPFAPDYSRDLNLIADMRAHIRGSEELLGRMQRSLEGRNELEALVSEHASAGLAAASEGRQETGENGD